MQHEQYLVSAALVAMYAKQCRELTEQNTLWCVQAAQLRVKKPNDAGRGGVHYTTIVDTAVYTRFVRLKHLQLAANASPHAL